MITSSGPLVSIGLPVYNGARFVARALDSLLAQDFANFELIVSDNCSTDGTHEICTRYARQDRRVCFSSTERNIGAIGNFTRVLDQARGRYFMWAADDDHWSPRFVRALLEELRRHRAAQVAMCALECVSEEFVHRKYIRFGNGQFPSPNDMNSFQLFKHIQYGAPYYMYIYGLFRTGFLRRALRLPIPAVPSGDVLFMSEVALATRFRYVEEVLHTRTLHQKDCYERYPEENSARLQRGGLWRNEDGHRALRRRLWSSRIIPAHRKLAALLWLQVQSLDFRSSPAGRLLHRLNRAFARQLG